MNKKIPGRGKSLKELSLDAVKKGGVKIVPERFEKVYFHWMENLRDWCVSRQIWFGHRIPAWYCADRHVTVARTAPKRCGTCGKPVEQDSDTFDTWFSSGTWTFTTLGWPKKTPDLKRFHPTSVLETGYDILFFWVARMILMTTYAMKDVPFKTVYLHGLVRDEQGRKMSKSLGNVLDPFEVIDEYGVDALRFYLMRAVQFGDDGPVSMDGVHTRYTSELANDLGNLASRTVKMVQRYRDGDVPAVDLDPKVAAEFADLCGQVGRRLDAFAVTEGLDLIWDRVRALNGYVQETQPWALAKDEANAAKLDEALATLIEGLRTVAVLLLPWLPDRMGRLLDNLGVDERGLREFGQGERVAKVRDLDPLFPRVERREAA